MALNLMLFNAVGLDIPQKINWYNLMQDKDREGVK